MLLAAAPLPLATDISATTVGVIAAVVAAASAMFVALNGYLKDRNDRQDRKDATTLNEREVDQTELARQGRVLDHLTLTMVGRAADPETGLPRVPGFTDEQRAHNIVVDAALVQLRDEVTTSNGGGTVKGSLGILRTQVKDMAKGLETLQTSVESLRVK